MKSNIFLGACCVTVLATVIAHTKVKGQVANQSPKSRTVGSEVVEPDSTGFFYRLWNRDKKVEVEKAASLVCVGEKRCFWCEKFKKETMMPMVKEGYDIKYIDKKYLKGPKIKAVPTLFFLNAKGKIVNTKIGYLNVEATKKLMLKPVKVDKDDNSK